MDDVKAGWESERLVLLGAWAAERQAWKQELRLLKELAHREREAYTRQLLLLARRAAASDAR